MCARGTVLFFLFSTVTKCYAESFGLRIKLMWASGWYLDPVDICEKSHFCFIFIFVIFIVIFCFNCLILLFCYLCQSGVGLGFVVYLYFCGRGEKICCFDLFVNPPSNFIFLLLDLFWHYKRSSETEGVFNFKFIFIVFVYYSFSTCIRIFCK